jgi:hypothetical protein
MAAVFLWRGPKIAFLLRISPFSLYPRIVSDAGNDYLRRAQVQRVCLLSASDNHRQPYLRRAQVQRVRVEGHAPIPSGVYGVYGAQGQALRGIC